MQRKTIVLDYVAADGAQKEITSQIVDVFAQAGADYLRLIDGELIRLDQIVAIDGLRLDRFPREV
ncbi:MAG: hypothetical protein K2X63_00855 [Burkholderiaceae bacterium]|nr:hypothetical protein [Burkholderiaceae bacterium]